MSSVALTGAAAQRTLLYYAAWEVNVARCRSPRDDWSDNDRTVAGAVLLADVRGAQVQLAGQPVRE